MKRIGFYAFVFWGAVSAFSVIAAFGQDFNPIRLTAGNDVRSRNVNNVKQISKTRKSKPQTVKSLQISTDTKIIDFDFTDFNGKPRKFSEFRGKYVLLDFWATWCKPCLADIPKLKELYEKHKAEGFEIIGMDSETLGDEESEPDPEFAKETAERAEQIVTARGVTWTQATSATAVPVASKTFSVKSLPTKILIDKEGKIIATIGEKDDLKGIIEKLFSDAK